MIPSSVEALAIIETLDALRDKVSPQQRAFLLRHELMHLQEQKRVALNIAMDHCLNQVIALSDKLPRKVK
jgi:predicted metal-dependent peptidase